MARPKNLLIIVNSGQDKQYNQYAAYVVAFMAKQLAKVEKVSLFYGPQGVEMARRGTLAQFPIQDSVKRLIADQLEGLSPSDLPDNLEQMARFLEDQLEVEIFSCGTFHVIQGFAATPGDRSEIDDFITPVKLPQAAQLLMEADKILYY